MMKSRVFAIAFGSVAVAAIAAAALLQPFSTSRNGAGTRVTAQAPASSVGAAVRAAPEFSSYELAGRKPSPAMAAMAGVPQSRGTFIVVFREPALAAYRGGVPGIAVPKRRMSPGGRERLDVKSAEARQYVTHLQGRQRALERRIATANRESLPVRGRMQHALNAIVVDMSNAQAARVARMPEVLLVEPYSTVTPDTDLGPALIGAAPVWNGTNPGAPTAYRGEGMVLGVIDTGVNIGSPSFAGVDPVDGYVHVNPLGAGNYLGTCAPGGADAGRCNSKLIGGYDMACEPPVSVCGQPNVIDPPGISDSDGHGSHTASIAAGNHRNLIHGGHPRSISGVAPRANLIAFDICYYDTNIQNGTCPTPGIVAAFDKAVSDGLVDVINYSFSGSRAPWQDAVPLAILNTTAAGIFVSAGSGNSGPTAGSSSHLAPWVSTTGAVAHGRGDQYVDFGVTGPGTVPAALSAIQARESFAGAVLTAGFPANTRIRNSPTFNANDDGCLPYIPNTFANAIALIRRGTCSHEVKVNNAAAAGAVAVVMANLYDFEFEPYTPNSLRPAIGISSSQGSALWNFVQSSPTATARIGFPLQVRSNTPDALGDFSARGPALALDLIKPDVVAPGVHILAAVAGPQPTGFESLVDVYSGVSMAAPHVAGAALLMRQARPNWTPAEVKSALMMTAKEQVLLEDNVTPADPHARGSGRVRVDRAINAGLVLNETTANFQAANPATGGSPSTLNLASMADATCAGSCSFTRTFRNARTYGSLWRVQLVGLNGTVQSLLWVPMGGTASLPVTIDTTGLPANGTWNFGSLVLTELFTGAQVNTSSELRLPIGVVVPTGGASLPFHPGASATAALDGAAGR
jgi:hypothetical protein